jgi:hypothetical protein
MVYEGSERRMNAGRCPQHDMVLRDFERGEERMERYETKIDQLIKGQADQALSIQRLQDVLSNGLRGDLKRTVESVSAMQGQISSLCINYEGRLKILENFSWFREWMTKMRDHLLQNVIKLALIGAFVYLLTHFGDLLIKRMLG